MLRKKRTSATFFFVSFSRERVKFYKETVAENRFCASPRRLDVLFEHSVFFLRRQFYDRLLCYAKSEPLLRFFCFFFPGKSKILLKKLSQGTAYVLRREGSTCSLSTLYFFYEDSFTIAFYATQKANLCYVFFVSFFRERVKFY